MITIVCFTRYCGISENIQRFVLVKYRVISVVYTSYVFKYLVDEKRTIVRTFQYTLFFRFPVHLGEQFCFLLVGGRQLIYGSGKEPTPPAFAGRGELAIVCSFTSGRTLRYYVFHLSNFTAIPSMIYWSLFKFFPFRFMMDGVYYESWQWIELLYLAKHNGFSPYNTRALFIYTTSEDANFEIKDLS